jgi:hypothetical protein
MMHGWITPLIAQVTREEFGRGFRGAASQRSVSDLVPYVAAFALLLAGWGLYSFFKRRNDMTERCNDPHKLFRELCLVHKLDRASRRLLLLLAGAHQMAQPAQVFVTPAAFEATRLPAALRGQAAEIKRLRERLF